MNELPANSGQVLICACGFETITLATQRCPECGAGVEVSYLDLDERIKAQPWPPVFSRRLTERYANLLPSFAQRSRTLGEGHSLLLRDVQLAREVGCREVFLAFEGQNPTGSFKDRGTAVAMSWALTRGSAVVGAVSTGNMAASVSAYARRNGLAAVLLVPPTMPKSKLDLSRVFGPTVVTADIDHSSLYFHALMAGERTGVYFMNGDDPMRIEGQKTALYDIYGHLHPEEPSHIFLPLSSGGNFVAYAKALRELSVLIARPAQLIGVQASGCAPIWQALGSGADSTRRVLEPRTVASAITNPFPPSGDRVLRVCRAEGHSVRAVSDQSMIDAQQDLAARHGLWVQVDSGASIAGLRQAALAGDLPAGSSIVCVLTGAGHRDMRTVPSQTARMHHADAESLAQVLSGIVDRAAIAQGAL